MQRTSSRNCCDCTLSHEVVKDGRIRESVANNMNSILSSKENKQLLDVLSFSYSHLLVHLKLCFVFMGMLKEYQKISVPEIINRWIAEGYLKPCNADNLEEIAEDYLKDLIDRNLIFADKGFCEVGIHDVLRELCLKIAEEEMFFYHDVLRESCLKIAKEEMLFYVVDTPQAICKKCDTPIVRSLIWPSEGEVSLDLRLLRILYKNDEGSYLEDNVEQVNLRYLQYRWNNTLILCPSLHISPSISLLWNLQTLIIERCTTICVAPYQIWEMLQLRHVDVYRYVHLPSVNSDQGDDLVIMRNLQTLKRVRNFKMSEEVCRRLPNIKELSVDYDDSDDEECDEVRSYYCPHNLGSFRKLESLDCRLGDWNASLWREFGLSLTFPSSLKKLILKNSYHKWEEMEMMVGSLPHLQTLELGYYSVIGSEWNPVEGKFLRLKNLDILSCYELVSWKADNSCFPVLENLVLESLTRLDEFPSGIGEIATLRSIVLKKCSASSAISAVRVVVEQVEELGNEELRLQVGISTDKERESFVRKVEEESLTSNNVRVCTTMF